jgi:RND superfamily putative drug exporter
VVAAAIVLFIVTRHRNGLKAGMSPAGAAARALDTSGRAVLFAGTTVCIALFGMLVLRITGPDCWRRAWRQRRR